MKEEIAVAEALQEVVSDVHSMSGVLPRHEVGPDFERGLRAGIDLAYERVSSHLRAAEARAEPIRRELAAAKERVAELTAATGAE